MCLNRILVGLAAIAWFVGCGSAEEPAAPEPTPPAAETPVDPTPEPEPEAPPAAETPTAGPGDPVAGAGHYKTYCATCHGETGCGDGPLSAGLDPKPAKHCDGSYMNALTDDYLFKVVKEGGASVGKSPLMAAWGGSLSDQQIRDVVAYMRSIADPPYPGAGG